MKKVFLIIGVVMFLLVVFSFAFYFAQINKEPNYFWDYRVTRVIDGDTFEMANGQKVRMICIDALELRHEKGEKAKEELENLVLYKSVILVKDVNDKDQYGRLLRYVYIINENETIFVNKEMVRSGYADVYRFGNDTTKCEEIATASPNYINNSNTNIEKNNTFKIILG